LIVEFREMRNGNWAAPFEMSILLPNAFAEILEVGFLVLDDFVQPASYDQ